jgi:hypothetical protein
MPPPPPSPQLVRTFVRRTEPWSFLENNLGPSHDRSMLTMTGGPGYGKSQIILNFLKDREQDLKQR